MAEPEGNKKIVNQVAIQAATEILMEFRDMNVAL